MYQCNLSEKKRFHKNKRILLRKIKEFSKQTLKLELLVSSFRSLSDLKYELEEEYYIEIILSVMHMHFNRRGICSKIVENELIEQAVLLYRELKKCKEVLDYV